MYDSIPISDHALITENIPVINIAIIKKYVANNTGFLNNHVDKDVYRRDLGDLIPIYQRVLTDLQTEFEGK